MNDEIKALKDRIENLESVIVYLVCPDAPGTSGKTPTKTAEQILECAINSPQVARGVNVLIEGYGSAEEVIQEARAKCDDLCDRQNEP